MCHGDEMEVNTCSTFIARTQTGEHSLQVSLHDQQIYRHCCWSGTFNQRSTSEALCNSTLSTGSSTLYHWSYTSSPFNTHFLHCIQFLCSPVVRTTFFLTLASGRNIWKSLKLLLSGSNTAVQKGSRLSCWKVCLKNQTPGESLPFLPQPIENLPCPVQRHPRPGHFSIQGKRMHKAAVCCCHRRCPGCLGKGRNDRNYDKAALFRENGLNIKRWFCTEECVERKLWADAEQFWKPVFLL